MEAEQGFVFRFMGDRVVIAGVSGIEASPVGAVHGMFGAGVIPEVFRTRAPARVEGIRRPLGRENSRQYWISLVYRGSIGAPVFVGEHLWGAPVRARGAAQARGGRRRGAAAPSRARVGGGEDTSLG